MWQAAGQTVELLVRILLMELEAVGEQARVPALPDELKENLQVNLVKILPHRTVYS